jgi:hypothetical protein
MAGRRVRLSSRPGRLAASSPAARTMSRTDSMISASILTSRSSSARTSASVVSTFARAGRIVSSTPCPP